MDKVAINQPQQPLTAKEIERVKARINKIERSWGKMWTDKLKDQIEQQSLWSGGQRLHFSFNDWNPNRQPDSQLGADTGNQAYLLAKKMEQESINVNLFGNRGTGKTSLALAMIDKVSKDSGKSWLFINTVELANLISRSYQYPESREQLNELYKAITGIKSGDGSWYHKPVDVLVLDDFGTEGGQKSDELRVRRDMQEWLYRASNARIDLQNNQPTGSTIITTNNTSNELLRMYDPKLISRIVTKDPLHVIDLTKAKDVRNG